MLLFIIKKDDGLLNECCFLEDDIERLYDELNEILNKQNEKYLVYVKDQEESILEKIFKNENVLPSLGLLKPNEW